MSRFDQTANYCLVKWTHLFQKSLLKCRNSERKLKIIDCTVAAIQKSSTFFTESGRQGKQSNREQNKDYQSLMSCMARLHPRETAKSRRRRRNKEEAREIKGKELDLSAGRPTERMQTLVKEICVGRIEANGGCKGSGDKRV